jgi:alpha-1,3-mannosyltransferase
LEDCVLNLARVQQAELGLSPRVVTLDRLFSRPGETLPATDLIGGVPVTRIPWRGSSRYPLAPSVLGQIRDADLVHVHGIDFFFDFLAATRAVHGKRLVASTHGGFFHTAFASGLKRVYFQTVTRLSSLAYDRVIACSEQDAQTFAHITPGNLVTVENGVDIAKFAGASSPAPVRTLIAYGRFARHKRLETLFPLLRALRSGGEDWRLIVAGVEGEVRSGDLAAAAHAHGVEAATRIVTGPTLAELRALIGEASYFVSLSAYEGFGLAAVEALSAGLVPVLSGIAPFRRLLAQAPGGLEFDPEAPQAAADALRVRHRQWTAGDGNVREAMMAAAQPFDWRAAAKRYSDAYGFAIPGADE